MAIYSLNYKILCVSFRSKKCLKNGHSRMFKITKEDWVVHFAQIQSFRKFSLLLKNESNISIEHFLFSLKYSFYR